MERRSELQPLTLLGQSEVRIKFDKIEHAVEFVSFDQASNQVFLSRDTGKLFYINDFDDSLSDELPEDFEEGDYLAIPDEDELDLKQSVVREFASGCSDVVRDEINDCFRRRGAYRNFEDLLDRKDLLDDWHRFRNQAEKDAIIAWCADNKIELDFEIE